MATEIRFKDDMRMMSPARDLKHCVKPMFKGATELATLHFRGNSAKIEELTKLVDTIIRCMNEAKCPESGTSMEVILRYFEKTTDVDPEVRAVLYHYITMVIMIRYVTGLRETTTEEALQAQDIIDSSVCSGIAASLPGWVRLLFSWFMRGKGKWQHLDKTAGNNFERITVDDIPPESIKD